MSLSSELYICVLNQDIEGVRRKLYDRNTQVDKGGARRDFWHYETPLELAVELNLDEIVELLINAGANVNTSNGADGWTPLHTAASASKCNMMMMLILHGANIEAQDRTGATPLFKAWAKGAELLIAEGANVDAKDIRGTTPLMHAVRRDDVKIVEILLAHHAIVNTKDNRGLTPLMHAVCHGEVKIVEVLLAHYADVNAKDNRGLTPLMHLAASYGAPTSQQLVIAKMLLENGANTFAKALNGLTAVAYSVRKSKHNLENFLRLEMDRQNFIAFAMASNDRLGERSQAAKLHKEMLRMVWEMSNET